MTYLLGDSFLMQPLADAFAVRTGWTCTRDSVGGSGYISAGMGTNFPARLAALIATAPDVVVVEGGGNDNAAGQTAFAAAVSAFYSALRAGLPDATLYIVGTHRSEWWTPIILAAAAETYGGRFISWDSWLTGTGYVGHEVGDGNRDTYIGPDGIHETNPVGATYLGTCLAFTICPPATGLDY